MGEIADLTADAWDYWGEEEDDRAWCKYCGCEELYWEKFSVGWRLVDEDSNIHTCKEYWRKHE